MGKLAGVFFIYFMGIKGAAFLAVGIFLALIFLKKKVQNMDEEKWEAYFKKLSVKKMLGGMLGMYMTALTFIGIIIYFLFRMFHYEYPVFLSEGMFVAGMIYVFVKYGKNRERLLKKLIYLHEER